MNKNHDDRRPGLEAPQLRLATMLWIVALLCSIFAVMGTAGPYAAFVLILLILAVFAHVSGNALGTRLRENGNRPISSDGEKLNRPRFRTRPLNNDDYAPTTQLGRRYALGFVVLIATSVGALLGAAGGGSLLIFLNWQRITIYAIGFAILFCGLLGGFAGFLTSSFLHVLLGAQSEAVRHAKRR